MLATLSSACASGWEPAFDEDAPPQLFENVAIAPLDDALTFARVAGAGGPRVVAVTAYRDGVVHGTAFESNDPIALFNQLGYDALRERIRAPSAAARITVPATQLVIPVDLGDHHVAAATNFPEHAGDAGVEDGPFLFPKLVQPTGPYAAVSAGAGLLDYEVEIAWVTLIPLARGDAAPWMGLVLANDFTDRDTLLHEVDPWNPASGQGFATGKSFPGFLPVGNLFVIPRDHRRFAAALDLRLYVDGKLRQHSAASEMVWDFDQIVAHTWAWKERRWDHRGAQVSLLGDADVIPARTLILSGTPHGTIFAGVRTRHMISGALRWLLGGWNEAVTARVISAYVADARAAGTYLAPSQRVEIHVDRLGVIRNVVVP